MKTLLSTLLAALVLCTVASTRLAAAPGDVDTTFNPNANTGSFVRAVAVQPDGKTLVGGSFTTIGGTARPFLARLNPNGSLDTAFNPNPDGMVAAIIVLADGQIIVGGEFLNIGGAPRARLARLSATGALDTTYDPGSNNTVICLALQPDGLLLVAGAFTNLAGDTRNRVGRLNPDGSLDPSFDPNVTGNVQTLALQPDGMILIGGGEPVLPGVSIGHNEHGAWGLTIFGTDSEDLLVYETNPEAPNEYRYQGRFEAMRVVEEAIPVKNQAAARVELKFTRHGPVLYEDTVNHRAYAIRAAWMEKGGAPYLSSLRMNQARTWEEFRAACAMNHMPSENMVWADRTGSIGWQAAGIAPLRSWSGLLPVPGDGRFEWNGYLPMTALPHEKNPERGFVVTANNYLYPNDYPYPQARHYTWADPYRANRIAEVLGSGRRFSVAEMTRLQNDDLSLPARALVPLLADLSFADPAVTKARDLLTRWDFVVDKDSGAAAVYELFARRLFENVRNLAIPPSARSEVPGTLISVKRIIDWLFAPDGRFGSDPVKGRDAVVARALEQGVADLTGRLGPDMAGWRWGDLKLHHALIKHPLSDAVNAEMRRKLEVGPLPRGGDALTVSATGSRDNQTSGGSLKIVADTEDWDNSVGLNSPGQSGNPDDPHYRDLFEAWARGRYFPLAYSRARVESLAKKTSTLAPAPQSSPAPSKPEI